MTQLVIASQFGEIVDKRLAQEMPHVKWLSIPTGAPASLPPEVNILLSASYPRDPASPLRVRPAGWPFNLKWVQLISAGIDSYPPWVFEVDKVSTGRGVGAEPIAEYVLAAIFEHAKKMPRLWVKGPEQWKQSSLGMVRDSTMGIVGVGPIGLALATKGLALGMKVQALRRSAAPFPVPGIERAGSLREMFAQCDQVVIAAPATPETRHMVNAEVLASAKKGLHLINIGRGSLIDQPALLAALDAGQLARATLDVTDPEPLPAGHPLYSHDKVRISPHTSAISSYIREALVAKVARNLARFQAGQDPEDLTEGN
ncbi:MAG TPA: NAD(P)-dependent oxidoreductase [Burkholderiaceae bacterium]|nr:NAD(P)-dependent oxidoreductase [Burkholderiaceae bacterium]